MAKFGRGFDIVIVDDEPVVHTFFGIELPMNRHQITGNALNVPEAHSMARSISLGQIACDYMILDVHLDRDNKKEQSGIRVARYCKDLGLLDRMGIIVFSAAEHPVDMGVEVAGFVGKKEFKEVSDLLDGLARNSTQARRHKTDVRSTHFDNRR